MNSIRPLLTITILAVVAVFLYLKINERPPRPLASSDRTLRDMNPEGVPPLDSYDEEVTDDAPVDVSPESEAPPWNGAAESAETPDDDSPLAALPEVPEIPALPEVTPQTDEDNTPTSNHLAPTDLPENIPVASYPGEVASGAQQLPPTAPIVEGDSVPVPTANLNQNPNATEPTPPTDAPAALDRYGNAIEPTTGPAQTLPAVVDAGESFSASWPRIEEALHKGELARAHQLLSPWYGNRALTPDEKQQVETLLSQLAGTVVYSTEHRLEPAHLVQPGESLETIGAKYNVPWQLLAKINGITSVDGVQVGQQLKVIRGPFSAVVDLANGEVYLNLDGRYAGRFPIIVPPDLSADEGEWIVMQKIEPSSAGQDRSLLLRPIAPTNDGLVLGAAKPETLPVGTIGGIVGMSPNDANEIVDILSVGSRVTIRR